MARISVRIHSVFIFLAAIIPFSQVFTVSGATPSWIHTDLSSGSVNALAFSGTICQFCYTYLLAGTDEGVFLSTDTGWSWEENDEGLTNSVIHTLAIDPPTTGTMYVYAGTDAGVFKAQLGIGIWSPLVLGDTILSLAIDPTTPSTIYAGGEDGIYKSTNSGEDWNTILSVSLNVHTLAIDPVTPSTIYAGTDYGVLKSTNSGVDWGNVNGIIPLTTSIYILAIDPQAPSTIYAGTESGIFKSTNGAGNWSAVNAGLTSTDIRTLAIDPAVPATLYAGTAGGGVFQTVDGGGLWSAINTGLTNLAVMALEIVPDDQQLLYAGTDGDGVFRAFIPPGSFVKMNPSDASFVSTGPILSWNPSSAADYYEYCYDASDNDACDSSWTSADTSTSASLSGLGNNDTYYWQVRAVNDTGTTEANGGAWWSFTARNQTFADVPINHSLWQYIEAFYSAGITTGCGVSPLIFCPENTVTRAAMAVFLLRAKYGASYAPPPATHTFADLPVAGKEWQEAWVDQFYLEGITGGCGTSPLRYCPENPVTRAAMAVFILRALEGASYTPPAASHFFADLPVAGKEWMEPWVDELYRRGITTGCGTGPLIYCPENPVKRQAMAAFIVRAFDIPLP